MYKARILTCAKTVQQYVRGEFTAEDLPVLVPMLCEGFRRAHDKSESSVGSGKFFGHTTWSEDALALLAVNDYKVDSVLSTKLSHEHVIPLNYVIKNILFTLAPTSTIDDILREIDTYITVAIITRAENAKLPPRSMPAGWDKSNTTRENIYARYVNAGVYVNLKELQLTG